MDDLLSSRLAKLSSDSTTGMDSPLKETDDEWTDSDDADEEEDFGEKFVYQKLDLAASPRQFRLVEVSAGSSSDAIRCRLQHYSVDDPSSSYEGLSYCWGDASDTRPIYCDGARLDITYSLLTALQALRFEDGPRLLWVDAICINQADEEEKTDQIGIMKDIYQKAQRTVVWLGEHSSDSEMAIQACQRMMERFVAAEDETGGVSMDDVVNGLSLRQSSKVVSLSEKAAVLALVQRPWFNRVWVIQEVGVAQKVTMRCGDSELDFYTLLFAVFTLILAAVNITMNSKFDSSRIFLLAVARMPRDASRKAFALPQLLERVRRFKSADDRDKLFALYGLTTTNLEELGLKPDYSLGVAEIYTQVTLTLLKNGTDLNLFEVPRGGTALRSQLASWVPDWSDNSMIGLPIASFEGDGRDFVDALVRTIGTGLALATDPDLDPEAVAEAVAGVEIPSAPGDGLSVFAASGTSVARVLEASEPGSIIVQGHMVDRVKRIGDVARVPNVDLEAFSKLVQDFSLAGLKLVSKALGTEIQTYLYLFSEWDRLALKDAPALYPTGESQKTAYFRTLMAGRTDVEHEQAERSFRRWRRSTQGERLLEHMPASKLRNVLSFSSLAFVAFLNAFRRGPKFNIMVAPTVQRRLARTAKGYLALVPQETQAGDIIALLKGGRIPFVLRPCGGPWRLLGGAYVHGIMMGEAFDEDSCCDIRIL